MMLTHYYHKEEPPFRSLSVLNIEEALTIATQLQAKEGSVYRRFKQPKKYLEARIATEKWLKEEFINKGGEPKTSFPFYMVIENSTWIEEGYNGQSKKIQISVSEFNLKEISFTYPDSMISYWLKDKKQEPFYQPDYHGQVFRLDEIVQIIKKSGIPVEEWKLEKTRKYDIFIEAQIWNEQGILNYLQDKI
ncbi:hypothetical protein PI95_010970 [Hassallia byssoidea VB512170]|uniref:Uncharacterized protein n=1 Tax=Hassallia byssoidea VB512170 TaxID=1304833 RepID=A0A846H620_9CYAN|nr:hypothetical protein [Hassalia byssoidea]NEU73067.1 hypothetical protein [Hassalia byssoidea VB512170]